MKPPKLKMIITTLLLIVLLSNTFAQYTLLRKGEKCPYDTAVAVRIDVYRIESQKLTICDQYITQQNKEIDSLKSFISNSEKIFIQQNNLLQLCQNYNLQKENTIKQLSENFDNLFQLCNKKPNWLQRNKFIIGLTTGIATTLLTITILR